MTTCEDAAKRKKNPGIAAPIEETLRSNGDTDDSHNRPSTKDGEKNISTESSAKVADIYAGPSPQGQKDAEKNMSAEGSPKAAEIRYAGCRTFISPTGYSGFVVGTDGDRAGWLYDFFASPRENEETVHQMMSLAIQQGANKLMTYEFRLLAEFFSQFGFQPCARVRIKDLKDAPPGSVPESCLSDPSSWPDFLSMILVNPTLTPARSLVSDLVSDAQDSSGTHHTIDSQQEPCARCEGVIVSRISGFGVFGGYNCPHCGFIYVYGTLTLGPPEPSPGRETGTSSPSPQEQACPCGNGKAFAECHGSE